jgi:hypothetical protein
MPPPTTTRDTFSVVPAFLKVSRDSRSRFQPRIVSNGGDALPIVAFDGLRDRPRAAKKPIYGKAANKRILALLDKPPPQGYAVDESVADRSIGRC